jgi:hypothetical protein
MSIPYRFMPWTRRGLARSHQNPDDGHSPLAVRPKVNVGLTLKAKQDGNAAADVSGNINLALYGPGDVIGIDPRLIVRTDPKPNITNFEPNYLAVIDFDPPDFPWLLTPAKANNDHHLRPWLVLVVLDRAVVKTLPRVKAGQPLPSINLTAQQVASELPDLAESWLWAHVQAVSPVDINSPSAIQNLATELEQKSELNISRLVCPRRLQPHKNYIACVVPAFEAGLKRGLGQPLPPAMTDLTPAWSPGRELELPVYYHWEFSTGPVGDIETLARRLQTPQQYQGNTDLLAQLRHIGEQPVAVDADHLLFAGLTPDKTVFEGAMVSLDFQPEPANQHPLFAQNLEDMLNSEQALADKGTEKTAIVPTLSPPIYGEHPAKRHTVDHNLVSDRWLDQLNLQPRYRLAAGWGAEVVRQNQDEFMQAAWTQVGEVLAAERALSLSRLAHDVLKRIEKRHLDKLPEHRLLAVLGAARARIKVAPDQSLYGRINATTLPDELFDGAMRRLTSARRPTFRMAQFHERALGANTLSTVKQTGNLVNIFASAVQNITSIDPNRFVPDGIIGSRSYDKIPLPDDSTTLIDLQPYTGLSGSMTAGEIRQITIANQTALEQAASSKRTLPEMDDIWHKGLLTDTHQLRLQQLQQETGQLLQGNLHLLIQQASRGGADGVLLSVQEDGQVNAQSLKIDEQGNIKAFSAEAGTQARPAVGSLGTLPVQALSRHRRSTVFTRLPPGTLGGEKPVQIGQDQLGRFSPLQEAPIALPTVTMPPAIKEPAVLKRYSEAFKDYQQLWHDPQDQAGIAIRPLDFALSQSTSQVRSRIDPTQTVPARLASMLSLADHPVAWSRDHGLAHDFVSARIDQVGLAERLRYIIPRTFDRVMAYPHLVFPLSRKLEKIAPEVFLPGVGKLPDDFIMAVETNPRFVEAFMLGANHEMGRELLWQGFPTDQRGTPFQHFWQRLDKKVDIDEIHRWNDGSSLGGQPGSKAMLVLLIRGQLLERFPTLSIYAYPKDAEENRPGGSSPPVPLGSQDPKEMLPERIELPVMKGRLGKDITYVGFNIDPDLMQNFFFILEEQMTEPRFGFDEPDNDGQNGPSWLDVDWSEVGKSLEDLQKLNASPYFGSANLKQAPPAQGEQWQNPHAATIANALLQRPFRGYYTGVQLKMPQQP